MRFSVLGDVGLTQDAAKLVDGIAARDDDLTLVVGDLSYDNGAQQDWCRVVTDRVGADYPVEIVAGNHEDDGPDGSIDTFTGCLPNQLPGRHGTYGKEWYLDAPAKDPLVRIVMISPALDFGQGDWSYARGTDHYAWTQQAVRGARAAGVPWVVVGMHKPCLSVGIYPCDPGEDLQDMVVAEKGPLVVTGHEHMYARTLPLALDGTCLHIPSKDFNPACLARRGTAVVTVGTGGHALREVHPLAPGRPYFAALSGIGEDPALGSLAVEVTGERLVARFEPAPGSTFTDTVSIERPTG